MTFFVRISFILGPEPASKLRKDTSGGDVNCSGNTGDIGKKHVSSHGSILH